MDNQHPRCECHECTQARARERIGTLGGCKVLAHKCPICGQIYNAMDQAEHHCPGVMNG